MADEEFLQEHRGRTLDEHINLGRQKSVSYLPMKTLEAVLGLTVAEYRQMIERGGYKCAAFSDRETCIKSGAVYAYSSVDLEAVLEDHLDLLTRYNWPTSADEFIKRIAAQWCDENEPVMPVIRAAFGERA